MKKELAVLLLVSLLEFTIASGCIQQAQQPTKSSILSALDSVNAYTYEFSERRTIQNRTYNIHGVVGIDRKTLHFFEFTQMTNENHTFKLWQYFDGSYVYFKVEDPELNKIGEVSIDELYKNMSKEEFIKMTIKTRDVLAKLKEMLENATIISIEKDGTLYKITFELVNHYEKAPTFLETNVENSEVIQDYINMLRRNVTENIMGIVWVDSKSLPVKLEVKKHIIEVYPVRNFTVKEFIEYNVTVSYKYGLPEWVSEVEKK
ncbi:hypothetical protein E3E31_01980 [Thermococcus sp. M39]|uniref:hypothetical protein n=1 Tax=unclassified Thermococcus TaxID=2627626 RepID=UPI00143C2D24|nr:MULTISPECIES: hypothetical protein [unclassified Thermococcus]NJE07324.1 hypothetical protein [Thermococcus sp. M39]NJE12545.1 hypothetical protein [Thermococcus sp. LS2]